MLRANEAEVLLKMLCRCLR